MLPSVAGLCRCEETSISTAQLMKLHKKYCKLAGASQSSHTALHSCCQLHEYATQTCLCGRQTRRQVEALLLQKAELAEQRLQLQLDNERLQVGPA